MGILPVPRPHCLSLFGLQCAGAQRSGEKTPSMVRKLRGCGLARGTADALSGARQHGAV